MPIIYTYPAKNTPVGSDLIVISDSEASNITKRATLSTAVTNNQIKYDLNATQDGLNVDLNLTSSDASDNSLVQFTAGTNVSLTRNSASEITISASGGGNLPIEDEGVQITGAAAKINFTGAGVTASAAGDDVTVDIPGGGGGYVLPLAANGTRGGIQIGYAQNAKNYPVLLSSEQAYVNVPWTDTDTNTTYTLQAEAKSGTSVPLKLDASSGTDSTVNLTEGANVTLTRNSPTEITIAAAGGGSGGVTSFTNVNGTYISASTVNSAATGAVTVGTIDLSAVDGTAVAGTRFLSKDNTWDVPAYTTYNAASSSNLGLIKLASDTEQSVAANAVTAEASRTYGIQFNADDQAVVNVPWTDTTSSPGGSNTQVQFNNSGAFAGSGNLTFVTDTLTLADTLEIKGDGTNPGILKLYCESVGTPHAVSILGPVHAGASPYEIRLPKEIATQTPYSSGGRILESDSSGALKWISTPSGGGGGFPGSVSSVTSNVSLLVNNLYTVTTSGATPDIEVTLPTAVGNSAKVIGVKYAAQNDINDTVVIKTVSSQTIDGVNRTTNGLPLASLYTYFELVSDGANWFIK